MTDRHEWQTAFLKQARADWKAYQRTFSPEWPACHRLFFLQMATEKLSKAFLVAGPSNLETVTHSHAAFVKFMRIIGNNRKLRKALDMKNSQQRAYFKKLFP